MNNMIQPVQLSEITLKKVNGIAHRSDSSALNYSANDISELQFIASQCPYEYGPAVYLARALLSPVDTTIYQNTCEILNEISDKNAIQSSPDEENPVLLINIFPNPTANEFSIFVEAETDGSYQFQIIDLNGRKLSSVKVGTFNSPENVDISYLNEGIYIVSIMENNGIIHYRRISVIK